MRIFDASIIGSQKAARHSAFSLVVAIPGFLASGLLSADNNAKDV
jgi:hypothetical protein